jgi:SGNH domain (fused to AT3 domains)
VVVGDSQAHSLAINQPAGIEQVMSITSGAVEGCGLLETGVLQSVRDDWSKEIAECKGWSAKWAAAARSARAEVALVVVGAWDVFDVERPDGWFVFATERHDAELKARLDEGIAALRDTGAKVALLEVACMRPIESPQSPVPLLPERGDDRRIAHLNELLKAAAAADPEHVTFLPGPEAWCNDPAVAEDLSFRWDGVHVYKPGAKLIFETIAAPLLAIPVGT